MHVETGWARRPIRDILARQKWDASEYRQITGDDIVALAGSVSGVPKAVYELAAKADRALDAAFINKLRLCKRSTERAFPNRYDQVVVALAFALDDVKRKIRRVYDTDHGAVIEALLPLHLLYMFVGLGEGLLRFQIVDRGADGALVRVESEVIGVSLLRYDWGHGRRSSNAVLNAASQHLARMRGA